MGMAYPQYELDDKILNTVLDLVERVKQENFPKEKLGGITFRPLRPEEVNPSFTVDTRVYDSTATGKIYERILGATQDFIVPTGSVYVFLGWIIIQDPVAGFDLSSVVRLLVEGVVRNEVNLWLISIMENNSLLTLDQIVVAAENTRLAIQFKNPTTGAGAHAIIFPLAYRIGPRSQLDVS